ncbi:hypothetical protein N665_6392s0001 [Sinapis alba]|nr:hypothetical protein N665_6392s0001 [Sinapis alba]
MSSSTSSSSRQSGRRTVGIPTRCWCGRNLTTFVSETKDNPYRRFYRCVAGAQRQTESHLFKWVDEAIIDEIKMIDSKHMELVEDVQALKKTMMEQFQLHKAWFQSEIRSKIDESARMMNEEMQVKMNEKMQMVGNVHNIAVVVVALGGLAWLYGKL